MNVVFLPMLVAFDMMRYVIILLLLSLLLACKAKQSIVDAKAPGWVSASQREILYPSALYFKGMSTSMKSQEGDLADLLNRLSAWARKELLESIRVSIYNETTSRIMDSNGSLKQFYQLKSRSRSQFDITNIIVEKYYHPLTHQGYAFAYVKKSLLSDYYAHRLDAILKEANRKLMEAKILESQKAIQKALYVYAQGLSALQDRENTIAYELLIACGAHHQSTSYRNQLEAIRQHYHNRMLSCVKMQPILLSSDKLHLIMSYGQSLSQALSLQAKFKDIDQNAAQIPIIFYNDTLRYCQNKTDAQGISHCMLSRYHMDRSLSLQYVYAKVDLAKYFNVTDTLVEASPLRYLSVPIQYTIHLVKPTFCIQSFSYDTVHHDLSSSILASGLNAFLSQQGFPVTINAKQAQYLIKIKVQSFLAPRQVHEAIYFAYVNVHVHIYHTSGDKEIYQTSYNNIKGAGIDPQHAVTKAYEKALNSLQNAIQSWLIKER